MLHGRVIDHHHREFKLARPVHSDVPHDTGRRLLAAADQAVRVLFASSAEEVDEVAAVIDDEVRVAGQGLHEKLFVLLRGDAVFSEGLNAHLRDRRRDVILGRERVAAGKVDFRAALGEDQA